MFRKFTWFSMLIIAFAGFVVLSLGFGKALQVTGNHSGNTAGLTESKKTENTAAEVVPVTKDPNSFNIVIAGDSIAYGTGDEKGQGFSTYLLNYLKPQTTKALSVKNIGINGLKSDGLLGQLRDKGPKAQIAASDFVLISIGGNDLREIRSRDSTAVNQNEFKAIEEAYLLNLKESLRAIRQANPNTYIVFIGLYNPYEKGASSAEDTGYMDTWNYDTQKLFETDPKAIFIPTYDIFKFNLNRFLAPDGLHPNSLGYQAVSGRIGKSVENIFNLDK